MARGLKTLLNTKYPESMDTDIISDVSFLDTGIPTINYLLSGKPLTGGFPLTGRMVAMYGPEGCGKSSFVAHMIAKAQNKDFDVVFFDTERSMTKTRLEQFGVNIEKLIYMTPEYMEEIFDIIETICKEKIANGTDKDPLLIVWDTVAMTATKEEISRKSTDLEIASQAKVLTRNLRRTRGILRKTNTGVLIINQARDNQDRFGDLFTMPGGRALHHTADIIVRVNKIKPNANEQGIRFSTPSKNKLYRPFQTTTLQFDYVRGFTKENSIAAFCEFLTQINILGKSGAWCYLTTEMEELMVSKNLSEKDAIKEVNKFYKKDFADRLINDKSYYDKIVEESEVYINKNILTVSKMLFDPDANKNEVTQYEEEVIIENVDIGDAN